MEKEAARADFWDDPNRAREVLKRQSALKETISRWQGHKKALEDLESLYDLAQDEEDLGVVEDIRKDLERLKTAVRREELDLMLGAPEDRLNAIMAINAGAGGTEAQDWAEMLLRMYTRWIESKGYKMDIYDMQTDTEAGIKSVTIHVEGENAYGYLKSEKGVHRLVRISPFDASNRRHTSFASVDVIPEIEDDNEIEINESDIRIDTYRSSGAGGQHVNTTDSAIRITHIPTGIVVSCQNQRSQHSNKETAMNMLKSKLLEIKKLENKEKIEDIQGKYNQIAWGSQIRSYVFHPYSMVKDHRTNAETGNVQAVMDGNIDMFINEYLKIKSRER